MTKLSISELLQLQSTIRNEIRTTEQTVTAGAFETINGDIQTDVATIEEHDASIVTLDSLYNLSIVVADKLHEANRGTTFVHVSTDGDEKTLNLASALDYVKQVRRKAQLFSSLGSRKEKTVENVYGSSERIVKTYHHDIPVFEAKAKELEKEANRLSREIERQSVITMVEVEGVEAYL